MGETLENVGGARTKTAQTETLRAEVLQCGTCLGSGEVGTDYGVVDCPDCGGAGTLPSQKVITEWRMADIERRSASGKSLAEGDVPWLLEELRKARSALHSVVALAHDAEDEFKIDRKIRFTANSALGAYQRARDSAPEKS